MEGWCDITISREDLDRILSDISFTKEIISNTHTIYHDCLLTTLLLHSLPLQIRTRHLLRRSIAAIAQPQPTITTIIQRQSQTQVQIKKQPVQKFHAARLLSLRKQMPVRSWPRGITLQHHNKHFLQNETLLQFSQQGFLPLRTSLQLHPHPQQQLEAFSSWKHSRKFPRDSIGDGRRKKQTFVKNGLKLRGMIFIFQLRCYFAHHSQIFFKWLQISLLKGGIRIFHVILHLQQKERIKLYYFLEAQQNIPFKLFSFEIKLLQFKMQHLLYLLPHHEQAYLSNNEIFSTTFLLFIMIQPKIYSKRPENNISVSNSSAQRSQPIRKQLCISSLNFLDFDKSEVILFFHSLNIQTQTMGQGNNKIQSPPSLEVVYQNVERLFGDLSQGSKVEQVNDPIITISRNMSESGSFQQKQSGFYVNPVLLKCVYHPNFEKTVKNMLTLLTQQLKSIFQSKVLALVSRQRFRKALNLANFCIFLSNQNLIQTINLLSVRSDLENQTKEIVKQYAKQSKQINHQLIDSIQKEELSQIAKMLRISMNIMVDLHLKLLTRSDFTLQLIDRLNQSVFVLYSKIFFSEVKEIYKRESQQNTKKLVKIGSYFLGLGIQKKTAPVYELAVLLLCSLFQKNRQDIKEQKPLPSHLFKSLPIVAHNNMIHWITNTLLFSLKYVKHENTIYNKMNMNRIFPFKLLNLIFQHFNPHDHQISYLLEEICLQTKPSQIQRVYVSSLAKQYAKTDISTQLIKKYAQIGEINYNIKGNNKQVKIKPEDVRTELEDNEDSLRKQMLQVCNKYIILVIFQKTGTTFEYSDKALWNMILYQMEEEGMEFQKEEENEMQLNKEGEGEQA